MPTTTTKGRDHADDHAARNHAVRVGQVADHFEKIIRALKRKPAIIGHSFGGLLAQILAGRELAAGNGGD